MLSAVKKCNQNLRRATSTKEVHQALKKCYHDSRSATAFSSTLGTLQQPGLLLSANQESEEMSGDTVSMNRKAGIWSWYYPLLFDLTFKTA